MDQTKNTWEQNKGTCTSEQKGQKEGIVHKVGDAIEHAGDTLKEKATKKPVKPFTISVIKSNI